MFKEIKLFHVHFDSTPDYIDLHEVYATFLGNAQKHFISIFSNENKREFDVSVIAEQIYRAIDNNKQYSFYIQRGNLHARIVFVSNSIKLYLQEPLIMKLHIEEREPSPDYVAYLDILLDLLESIRIDGLEINEEL
ncbi:MAG: hypothetical protein AB7F19_03490 [Candidatus Babeliales bacterium]